MNYKICQKWNLRAACCLPSSSKISIDFFHRFYSLSFHAFPHLFAIETRFEWNTKIFCEITTSIVRRSYDDFPKPWHRVYMEFYCIFWLLGLYWAGNRMLTNAYPWGTFFISNFSHLLFLARLAGSSKINFSKKGHMIYHFKANLMLIIFSFGTMVWKWIFQLF